MSNALPVLIVSLLPYAAALHLIIALWTFGQPGDCASHDIVMCNMIL